MIVDGILNIHKPSRLTSFQVVSFVRRLSKQKRVGHGGTLDPMATGVLLVLLGRATRIAEYLLQCRKVYRAVVELGVTTDTYDADGVVTGRQDVCGLTAGTVEEALKHFMGEVWQTPPMFSAVRHKGKHLYELARTGVEVLREARPRQVHKLEILSYEPPLLTLEVECQGGFYVRSLAHDLGQRLGCGGSLKELCRTKSGAFRIEDSWSMDKLRELFATGEWSCAVSKIDDALAEMKAITLGEDERAAFLCGKALERGKGGDEGHEAAPGSAPCRVYSAGGDLLGVGSLDGKNGILYPKKVLFRGHGTEN